MKGIYLFAPTERGLTGPSSGVEKKIRSQCAALQEYVDCELMILPIDETKNSLFRRIYKRLPFTRVWRKWEYNGEFDHLDFLYIRQVYHDDAFVRYLRKVKKSNSNLRIIYEVPTYPYGDNIVLNPSNFMIVEKERICRKKAAKYFDRIVTFYGQKKIWGVPCIKLMNGFPFSTVEIPERKRDSETIHVISVAIVAFWHGYDRFIEGLHNYYESGGTEKIVYHYVGEPLPEHVALARKYGLDGSVIQFCGKMDSEQLKDIYKECFIGIDVLGGHRVNYRTSSSLKSREYAAYGIPLLTSSPVDYIPEGYPYQLLAPYDDSPVNINDFVQFYHSVYDGKDCNEVAKEIRAYAEARCDMSMTMKPVADWLKSN